MDLRGIPQASDVRRVLHLRWRPESAPAQAPGVQDKVVTEWADCGIACAVAPFYTGFRVRSVADEGDRFDYWLGDGKETFGLEVSGTLSTGRADLEARHRAKVRQLRENPYGVDGFVTIVGLEMREIILSRHRFEEAAP